MSQSGGEARSVGGRGRRPRWIGEGRRNAQRQQKGRLVFFWLGEKIKHWPRGTAQTTHARERGREPPATAGAGL